MDRVAGELARELKQTRKRPEQDELAAALRHLFRLAQPAPAPISDIDAEPAAAGLE
jgi:hypothetical protein